MSNRRSSRIQDKEAREAKQREDALNKEIEYNLQNLSTELTDKQKQRIARNRDEELKFSINSQDWIIFF